MLKNKLSASEVDYLNKNFVLPLMSKLEHMKFNKVKKNNLTSDECSFLRDLCEDRLQICGFDDDYQLTEEGKILEALSDKLYESGEEAFRKETGGDGVTNNKERGKRL